MSTDSSELTFVRCPACRSLVPAVSTRCRMCGATLDASQAVPPEDQEAKKTGRVRQRTMSHPDSLLSSTADKVREDSGDSSARPEQESPRGGRDRADEEMGESVSEGAERLEAGSSEQSQGVSLDDPLSAFVEEVEVEDSSGAHGKSPNGNGATPAEVTDTVMVSPENMLQAKAARPPASAEEAPPADSSRPRVIVESGPRRGNRPGGLSFGKPPQDRTREEGVAAQEFPADPAGQAARKDNTTSDRGSSQRPGEEDRAGWKKIREDAPARNPIRTEHRTPEGHRPPEGQQNREAARQQGGKPNFDRNDQSREAHRDFAAKQRDQSQRPRDRFPAGGPQHSGAAAEGTQQAGSDRSGRHGAEEARTSRSEQNQRGFEPRQRAGEGARQAASADSVQFAKSGEGRLFGWLVSYSEAKGKSFELREGRFLVTASSLKPTDFVIAHDSVSTPHAFVTVSLHDGLRIQDLESDRGLWLKRRNSDSYQRVAESARVEHGDWVRFGEIEFQVSVAAHVGGKGA